MMLTACATMKPQQRSEHVSFLDYRPYTSAGFFLSPDSYPGKFESIGQLDIMIIPEQVSANDNADDSNNKFNDGIYAQRSSLFYQYKEIPAEELLETAVEKALEKGANGIANLKISRITSTSYTKYGTFTTLSHYEVSGLVIKTLD